MQLSLSSEQEKEIYNKFKEFLSKYNNKYSDYALEYIATYFLYDIKNYRRIDIMNQIYAEIGVFPDNKNLYKGILNFIKEKHDINCNILEIGCGYFPIFAKYIDEEQKKSDSGSITVYDPNLVVENLGNIILNKRFLLTDDNIDRYDLVVGISPCEATELLINKASLAKKDFIIALCECTFFNIEDEKIKDFSISAWHEYVKETVKMLNPDKEVEMDYLCPSYDYEFPIISCTTKKKVKSFH